MQFTQLIDTRQKKFFWGIAIVFILLALYLREEPTVGPGDTIVMNYTISINGVIVDTSLEEVAEKANIYDKDRTYEPLVIVIGGTSGEAAAPLAVERAILGMKVGQEKVIRLYPLDAYGYWNEAKTVKMSLEEFKQEAGLDPEEGQTYQIGNVLFNVLSVTEDEVVLDFNHRFAALASTVSVSREEFEQSAEAYIGNQVNYRGQFAIVIEVTETEVILDVNPAVYEFNVEIIQIKKA